MGEATVRKVWYDRGETTKSPEVQRTEWRVRLAMLGCPIEYRDGVPHDLPIPKRLEKWPAQAWLVVFSGAAGVGKTWLATRLLGERFDPYSHRAHSKPAWADALQSIEQMRREIGSESSTRLLDKLMAADALLIDDIGAGKMTEFMRDRWMMLLRARHAERLPTILTTNQDGLDGLAVSKTNPYGFDSPTISRLSANAIDFPMVGEDRRVKA